MERTGHPARTVAYAGLPFQSVRHRRADFPRLGNGAVAVCADLPRPSGKAL
jgi:hypothetical protein